MRDGGKVRAARKCTGTRRKNDKRPGMVGAMWAKNVHLSRRRNGRVKGGNSPKQS